MAKKKKKTPTDIQATFGNGLNIGRAKHSVTQGFYLLLFLCLLGLFAYFVMMIPGLASIFIAKEGATRNQTVYDIQNSACAILGLLVGTIGCLQFGKQAGQADALYVTNNKIERKFDLRCVGIMMGIAAGLYIIAGVLLNIDLIVGPVKYISIIVSRAPRVMPGDDPQEIGIGFRFISMMIYMVLALPCMFIGIRKGYHYKLSLVEEEEERMKVHEQEMAKQNAEAN